MRTSTAAIRCIALVLVAGAISACRGPATAQARDAGPPPADASAAAPDAGSGSGADGAGIDAGTETDAGAPTEADAGGETNDDAGVETNTDAGSQSEADAGAETDAGSPFDTSSDGGVPYDADGPFPWSVQTATVSNGGQTYNLTIYLPTTGGPHPLVSFWCGTQQTAAGYTPYAQRLASYGIAMMIADDPGVLVATSTILPTAVYLVDTWAPMNLGSSVDLTRVGLSGHSRGGALTIFAAAEGLNGKVVAWLGLDAVDNPIQNSPLAQTVLPDIGIANGFLGAAVATDCAPTSENYVTLYPLAPSPSVLVAFAGANHIQFEDPAGCTLCGLCMPAGTADENVVLAAAVRYFTAFFARELLGDTSVGPAFEGAGAAADVDAGVVTISSR